MEKAKEKTNGVIHSPLGASSMYRWSACPGSVQLSKGLPNVSSKDADLGTEAHDWLAKCLLGEASTRQVPSKEGMRDAVTFAYDAITEQMVAAGVNKKKDHERGIVFIEERFSLEEIFPECFGTADVGIYDRIKKRLTVIDYKNGAGIYVGVIKNKQLLYYGLGMALRLEHLDIEEVRLQIIQPRCEHGGNDLIRSWDIDIVDLYDFAVELRKACEKTALPDPNLTPGDHCHFCLAKPTCPALSKLALVTAQDEFGDINGDDETGLLIPSTPEQLSKALTMIPMIETWCKAVRSHAYIEMSQGRPIPGVKLVEKRKRRNWTSVEETTEFFNNADIDQELIYKPKELKSPAQVEKALKLNAKEKRVLNTLITNKSTGLTLVPEKDPRPAIAAGAEVEFDEIEEDKI